MRARTQTAMSKLRSKPQSQVACTMDDIKAAVTEEMSKQRDELFIEDAETIMPQAVAAFLWVMAKGYGFGGKRLKRLCDELHEYYDVMVNPSRLHHRFGPLDTVAWIKDKYGIDLEAEFKADVEIKVK